MMSNMKVWLPILVVGIGIVGAVGMIAARPEVRTAPPEIRPPLIRVVVARIQDIQLRVRAQGTVTPRTESDLIPEVAGRVTWVSPSLAAGGFFEAGEVLLRVEPRDYEVAVERNEAARARRQSEYRLAEANLARSKTLAKDGVVSAAALDEAENAAEVASAALREARAALEQAVLSLERTEIRAPFAGRVRREQVDVGQFVVTGNQIARLYAVDFAEIRLPIPDDQLAFLDLPLEYRGKDARNPGPPVVVTAKFAGREHQWEGRIVRTEGEIDPRSRMMYVVAQVENPYGRGEPGRPPLAVGLFVKAEIVGRRFHDVIVLPREAMRGKDQVLVADDDNRLHFRQVEVLRADREQVVLRSGVAADDRVCISPLEAVADGMKVRVVEEDWPLTSPRVSRAVGGVHRAVAAGTNAPSAG